MSILDSDLTFSCMCEIDQVRTLPLNPDVTKKSHVQSSPHAPQICPVRTTKYTPRMGVIHIRRGPESPAAQDADRGFTCGCSLAAWRMHGSVWCLVPQLEARARSCAVRCRKNL
jgi:hypothetical protein